MDKWIWDFIGWINERYGRPGLVVALLIIVGVVALVFFLLSRLPERKEKQNENERDNSNE